MEQPTRRAVVKGLSSVLTVGAVGGATGHPSDGEHPSFSEGHDIHRHHETMNTELVGFHTLGNVGSESVSGGSDNPLYGMITDVWLEGDLGFVSMQTSSPPTGNRGVAILDVSAYTRAESRAELDRAEMTVLSYIGNESEAGTGNSVKVSDDGQYLAYSKQAIGAIYGRPASASTEDQAAAGPNVTGAEVYDISDPGDPEYVGSAQGPNAGFHNCFVHQIGGDHYVFGIQGVVSGDAGVHVYRITDGGVVPVNFWGGDDLPVTDYGTDTTFYCHDFYAHHDPKTGKPLGFIAYWNNGVRVLDLSDPTDLTELGVGRMNVAHYAQPVPELVDGKRLFVGGQEVSSRQGSEDPDGPEANPSGYVYLFDGDALFEDGVTDCPKLAEWTLYGNVTFEDYAYSPHNNDIVVQPDGDAWITQANYHAGVRFLKIEPPGEGEVNTDEWHLAGRRVRGGKSNPNESDPIPFLLPDNSIDPERVEAGTVVEEGKAYYSDHVEVPPESATDDNAFPNFWDACSLNGVTFGASQHTGLYAIAADPMTVGTRTAADASVTRSTDGRLFTGGQTNRLEYEVQTDATVRLRDRLPSSWEVVGGDAHTAYDTGDGRRVEFDEPVQSTGAGPETRTLFVSVSGNDAPQVGPIQVATDGAPSRGGKDWETMAGTVESSLVGPSQP